MNRLVVLGLAAATTAALVQAGCKDKAAAPAAPSAPADSAKGPTAPAGGPAAADRGGAVAPATSAATTAIPTGTGDVVPVPDDIAGQVGLVAIATGLKKPVAAVVAPGDARKRIFIVEQHKARIRVLEAGKLAQGAFFDLGTSKISNGGEQGLLGLAFHPKFATNGKLYVHYTAPDDSSHVVEYQVSKASPDAVDLTTAREVFSIAQPYSNHNGGHVLFGPDGLLYIGLGDGGAANDPLEAGQDLNNLLAKMLRIDVDQPDAKPEIVHYGLRNPWRYAFDAKTGDFYIGDVGQNKWEYVFVVAGGDRARKNFGWSITEGSHCFQASKCDKTGITLPIAEYSHDEGCSITGGVVYRGKAIPALDGVYFYADYCTSLVRSFRWYADAGAAAGGVAREHWDWRAKLDPKHELQSISSFGTDADGELLIVTLTGKVFQLAPTR
jgi:glucose/arabinose dehydrogenase